MVENRNTNIATGHWFLVSMSIISISNIARYYKINMYSIPKNLIPYCQYILELATIWNH